MDHRIEDLSFMCDWLYRDGTQEEEINVLEDHYIGDDENMRSKILKIQKGCKQLVKFDRYLQVRQDIPFIPSGLSYGILLRNRKLDGENITYIEGLRGGSQLIDYGIKFGDLLIGVNGKKIQNATKRKVIEILGESKQCTLELLRMTTGETLNIEVEKRECEPFLTKPRISGLEYLSLPSVENAVIYSEFSGGIILDLRGNPGGNMQLAGNFAEQFIPPGNTIFQTKTAYVNEKFESEGGMLNKNPIVILVDGQTASAGEVIACALKSNRRGIIVGTETFGKGVQQKRIPLGNNFFLHYTNGEILGPNGESWDKNGLKPDISVPRRTKQIINGQDAPYIVAANILLRPGLYDALINRKPK